MDGTLRVTLVALDNKKTDSVTPGATIRPLTYGRVHVAHRARHLVFIR